MPRFGSREISNVVIKEIATKKPVLYLESLTVSSMEQTAEAVYARGGRGNPKRIMWEADKEVMYNMTDALIQPESLAMLLGTDIVNDEAKPVHKKEFLVVGENGTVDLAHTPSANTDIFVFETTLGYDIGAELELTTGYTIVGDTITFVSLTEGDRVIVDYYYDAPVQTMTVEVDKFAGYYYIEAQSLWRRESDGVDLPAYYIMPRVKFSSNFSIENAAAGDPATFDFNVECFPDEFNRQVIIDVVQDTEEE